MRRFLLWVLICCLLWVVYLPAALADDLSAVETISFNQLPPFEEEGSVPSLGEYAQEVGYEVARSWGAGEYPVDVLKIGDILDGLHPEEFRLSELIDLETVPISEIRLLADLPLSKLLESVPFSGDWPIEQLPGVAEALSQWAGLTSLDPVETLGEIIAQHTDIGELLTGDVLGDLPVNTIPNIDIAKIGDFEGFQEQAISNIPRLGDIALGNFPNPLQLLSFTAQQDIALGKREYSGEKPTPKPVSGSVKEGFQVPCIGGCPHIELTGSGWEGDQWMTKDHRVPDGSGLLGGLPGMGEAGAYRLPFGESFALQIRSTDEKAGAAEWGLAFRVCSSGLFFDLGCTAYFLEVPLGITTYEKDTILTGLKDGQGGQSQPVEAPPGWEDLRPDVPPELQSVIDSRTKKRGSRGLCGKGPGGVDYEGLAVAFSQIEGNYNSVGEPTDGGRGGRGQILHGVGLGRYQYMSYREDVRAAILKQPGGAALLDKADRDIPIAPEEVARSFPPEVQDRLFRQDQERLIEQAIAEGAEGEEIIRRIGQRHYSGRGGEIDGQGSDIHGRLTIKDYGDELLENYKAALEGKDSECGQSTGNFIIPIDGPYQKTSGFGSRTHPVTGEVQSFHNGLDFGSPTGTTVIASDGGTIIAAQYNDTAGNHVIIDHGNGYVTSYSHLSQISVAVGDGVKQGDKVGEVGSTGRSTGPHLHFVIKNNGEYENPEKYV